MARSSFVWDCIQNLHQRDPAYERPRLSPRAPSPQISQSEREFYLYYSGIPSYPLLLARTGLTPYEEPPPGPESYRKRKKLGIVVNHKLNSIWEYLVAPRIQVRLDELGVLWTSLDVVRIGEITKAVPWHEISRVVLWIGVIAQSLDRERSRIVAFKCLDILQDEFDITDVDVEIRESRFVRLSGSGPPLLPPPRFDHSISHISLPLTQTLGIPITPMCAPGVMGTGGFFMRIDGNTSPLYLVTARHVVSPPHTCDPSKVQSNSSANCNCDSNDTQMPSYNEFEHLPTDSDDNGMAILLLEGSDKAYRRYLASIRRKIGEQGRSLQHFEGALRRLAGLDDESSNISRKDYERTVGAIERNLDELVSFYHDVKDNWSTTSSRTLGHVIYPPSSPLPLASLPDVPGPPESHPAPRRCSNEDLESFKGDDYAIIQVSDGKINNEIFTGNTIFVGSFQQPGWLYLMKIFFDKYFHSSACWQELVHLRGTIPLSEMRSPKTRHKPFGDESILVMKRGSGSEFTIGCASSMMSFVREYPTDQPTTPSSSHMHPARPRTYKYWPILRDFEAPNDHFSFPGDSGSVVVDGEGRMGGMIVGGAVGKGDWGTPWPNVLGVDITYVLPMDILLESIREKFPGASVA